MMHSQKLIQDIVALKDVTLSYIRGNDATYAEDIMLVVTERGTAIGVGQESIQVMNLLIKSMRHSPRPLRAEDVRIRIDAYTAGYVPS